MGKAFSGSQVDTTKETGLVGRENKSEMFVSGQASQEEANMEREEETRVPWEEAARPALALDHEQLPCLRLEGSGPTSSHCTQPKWSWTMECGACPLKGEITTAAKVPWLGWDNTGGLAPETRT